MDESACIDVNPDITGLGVRLSFYFQTAAIGASATKLPMLPQSDVGILSHPLRHLRY